MRVMISDLKIGESATIPLIIKVTTARETKAKKPFLNIEFYDGVDTIVGNYWDWNGASIPPKTAVYNVAVQVGEWQGAKQLTVKGITTNYEIPYSDFMPSSGHDLEAVYAEAYALLTEVKDDTLRDIALGIFEATKPGWMLIPGAARIHHAYVGGTLVHSLAVAKIAKAIAENTPGANVDLTVVGAMLHDLGKLYTYEMDGINIVMTAEGMMKEHAFMGAEFVGNFADKVIPMRSVTDGSKIELLRHIILSHHGKLEYGAVVTPMCIEAYIVNSADMVDATAEQIREESRKAPADAQWTGRIWALDNKLQMTTQYVNTVMTLRE